MWGAEAGDQGIPGAPTSKGRAGNAKVAGCQEGPRGGSTHPRETRLPVQALLLGDRKVPRHLATGSTLIIDLSTAETLFPSLALRTCSSPHIALVLGAQAVVPFSRVCENVGLCSGVHRKSPGASGSHGGHHPYIKGAQSTGLRNERSGSSLSSASGQQ